jgi:hypothetical protein
MDCTTDEASLHKTFHCYYDNKACVQKQSTTMTSANQITHMYNNSNSIVNDYCLSQGANERSYSGFRNFNQSAVGDSNPVNNSCNAMISKDSAAVSSYASSLSMSSSSSLSSSFDCVTTSKKYLDYSNSHYYTDSSYGKSLNSMKHLTTSNVS